MQVTDIKRHRRPFWSEMTAACLALFDAQRRPRLTDEQRRQRDVVRRRARGGL